MLGDTSGRRRGFPLYPRVDAPIDERASANQLVAGVVATAVVVGALWGADVFRILFERDGSGLSCFLSTEHGGDAGSFRTMAVTGVALWLVATVVAWRWRRHLLLVFGGCVALYAAALGVLWAVAPSIWGPLRCS